MRLKLIRNKDQMTWHHPFVVMVPVATGKFIKQLAWGEELEVSREIGNKILGTYSENFEVLDYQDAKENEQKATRGRKPGVSYENKSIEPPEVKSEG